MRGLITLVNDNQVDNYHNEILAFVYYGSNVNNWPKNQMTPEGDECPAYCQFGIYGKNSKQIVGM